MIIIALTIADWLYFLISLTRNKDLKGNQSETGLFDGLVDGLLGIFRAKFITKGWRAWLDTAVELHCMSIETNLQKCTSSSIIVIVSIPLIG